MLEHWSDCISFDTVSNLIDSPLILLEEDGTIQNVNSHFCRTFHLSAESVIGTSLYHLHNHQWDLAELHTLVQQGVATQTPQSLTLVANLDGDSAQTVTMRISHVQSAPCLLLTVEMAETAPLELEAVRNRFFDLSTDLFVTAGPEGYFQEMNQAWSETLGYTHDELLAVPFFEFVHPEDRERTLRELHKVSDGKVVRHFENRYRHKDGSYRWLSWMAELKSQDGLIYASARDITRRKEAEAAQQDTESLLYSILDSSLDGIMAFSAVRDENGRIVDFEWLMANQRSQELTGRNPFKLLGKRLLQEMPGNLETGLFDVYVRVVETGEPATSEFFYNHDGIQRWFQNTAVKLQDGFVVTFRDITQQREMQKVGLAMATGQMGTWELDLATMEVKRSSGVDEIFELPADGSPRKLQLYLDRIHPDDHQTFQETITQAIQEKRPHSIEYRVLRQDGSVRWVSSRGTVVLNEQGEAIRKVGALTDISEQKRTEAALRLAEERFRIALQHTPIIVFNQDLERRYTWVYNNPQSQNPAVDRSQNPNETPLGKRDTELTWLQSEGEALDRLKQRVLTEGVGVRQEVTITPWHASSSRSYDLTLEPLRDAQGEVVGLTGAAVDITEYRTIKLEIEERARQQAIIAELGQQALTGISINTLMQNAVSMIASTLNVEYCKVLELLPSQDALVLRAGVGWQPEYRLGEATVGIDLDSQAGYTLATNGPVIVYDLPNENRFSGPPLLRKHGVVSGISVVIAGREAPYGVLGVHTREKRQFSHDQVSFLQSIANLLAMTVERRQAEQEQEEARERIEALAAEHGQNLAQLQAIFANITEGLIIANADGTITGMNPAALALHGLETTSTIHIPLQRYTELFQLFTMSREAVPAAQWPLARALRHESFQDMEFYMRRQGEDDEWIASYSGTPVYNHDGELIFAVLTIRNITAAKKNEQALAESENRFRSTFENAAVGISHVDLSGQWIRVNQRLCDIVGYSEEELLSGMTFQEITHPEDLAKDLAYIEKLSRGEIANYQMEKRYFHKNGQVVWINLTVSLERDETDQPVYFIAIIEDITERKEAEQALGEARRQQAELLSLLESSLTNAPIGFAFFDREHRFTRINETLAQINDLPVEEHLGRSLREILPASADRFDPLIDHVFETHRPLQNIELASGTQADPDSKFHWLISLYPVMDQNQDPIYVGVVVVNITDRKQAEEALRRSEERFRVMAETLPTILFTCQPDGALDYINRRFTEYTGLAPEEAMGGHWKAVLHPQDVESYWRDWQQALPGGTAIENEFRIRTVDGSYRWFVGQAHPIYTPEGTIARWVGTCTDIHDQKMAEEALRRNEQQLRSFNETLEERVQQRTRQVRELASALTLAEQRERRRVSQILHDHVQQMLYGVQMRAHLLKLDSQQQKGEAVQEHIRVMNQLVDQAIRSTRSLSVELSPPVLKNEGLAAAFDWLARNMSEIHGLTVQTHLVDDYQPASEDLRVLVFQVTRELLFNVVKHANTNVARLEMQEKGPNLVVRVIDHGDGFNLQEVENKERQPEGGFGLYSIQERLALFGGHLIIESSPSQGTTASVVVPRHPTMPSWQSQLEPVHGD